MKNKTELETEYNSEKSKLQLDISSKNQRRTEPIVCMIENTKTVTTDVEKNLHFYTTRRLALN